MTHTTEGSRPGTQSARGSSRSLSPPEFKPLPVSADDKEEYEYLLAERAAIYVEQGLSDSKADALALDDFGCVEFWQYVNQLDEWIAEKHLLNGVSELSSVN